MFQLSHKQPSLRGTFISYADDPYNSNGWPPAFVPYFEGNLGVGIKNTSEVDEGPSFLESAVATGTIPRALTTFWLSRVHLEHLTYPPTNDTYLCYLSGATVKDILPKAKMTVGYEDRLRCGTFAYHDAYVAWPNDPLQEIKYSIINASFGSNRLAATSLLGNIVWVTVFWVVA